MIGQRISLMMFVLLLSYHSRVTNGQLYLFHQPATVPSSVCERSDVTLQCVIILISADNRTSVRDSVWSRNTSGIITTISTQTPIPNHRLLFDSTTGAFTDLVITDVTLEDNNTVYSCSAAGTTITSSVVLNVTGVPAVENLTAVDNCTSVTVSWDITDEVYCKDLSYNVSLISPDDGVTLQSITTDATNHTFTGVETSNVMFNVNVTAFTENARGPSHTATADVRVSANDLPSPVDLRTSTICVTFFNISWNASNRITCGDVSYEVSVFQSSIEQSMDQFTRIGDTYHSSVTGLNNSDPDVMVTVTASNRAGQGNMSIPVRLPPSLDPPPVNDVKTSISRTPYNLSGFDIFITWTRPVIYDPCTTLPDSLYIINTSVAFINGSQANYVSNNILDTSGDSMGRFIVSYNDSFDEELVPNATYVFAINSEPPPLPPPPTPCKCVNESDGSNESDESNEADESNESDESDDELSTGVAVAISIVVTFIITLVVTALISIIITSLYYNYQYELKEKVRMDDDDRKVNTYKQEPYDAMDTNPTYGTATTFKTNIKPAYTVTAL